MAFVLTFVMALSASTMCLAAMQGDVDQAVAILQRFQEIPEKSIPPAVLKQAKGLAILTATKAGFIVSGRGGAARRQSVRVAPGLGCRSEPRFPNS
jgi:lipid-binding SYLF domain-containing protein